MLYVIVGLQVVIIAVLGALFKYVEVVVDDFKSTLIETMTGNLSKLNATLEAPNVRHHLTKNVDLTGVKVRRAMLLKEARNK